MKSEPLTKEERKIEVTNAICVYCKEFDNEENKVTPEIAFDGEMTVGREWIDDGNFHTYWDCENHGAVPAILNGEIVPKPSDLLSKKIIRIDDDFFVNLKEVKTRVQKLLKEIEKLIKEQQEKLKKENESDYDYLYGDRVYLSVISGLESQIEALEYVKDLIKKAFGGVMND